MEKKKMQEFRTAVSQKDIFSIVIEFLMNGGVFKIGKTYYAFSNDLLLCELVDAVETEHGSVEATTLKASNLTLNEFLHGCLGASRDSLDNIDFMMCDGITEC
jgi:hypothetical protein